MNKILKQKVVQVGLALMLVVGLLCSTALPAMAEESNTPTPAPGTVGAIEVYKGKVTEIGADSNYFVIQTLAGELIRVSVNDATKYFKMNGTPAAVASLKESIQDRLQKRFGANAADRRGMENRNEQSIKDESAFLEESEEFQEALAANIEAPQGWFAKIKAFFFRNPKFGHKAKYNDIEVGDGIVVRAEIVTVASQTPATQLTVLAKQMMIIKCPNIKITRGVVTAVSSTALTIKTSATAPESMTFKITENTHVVLKGTTALAVDQNVTVTYKITDTEKIAQNIIVINPPPTPSSN